MITPLRIMLFGYGSSRPTTSTVADAKKKEEEAKEKKNK